jgi:hypothetical protein
VRIHPTGRDPLFFGPAEGQPPRNRWDAPAGEFGVCYLAEYPDIAFAESFLREPGKTVIQQRDLATRSESVVVTERSLRLAAFHGSGLARLGATAAVAAGPYAVSRQWSKAVHGHPSRVDGIRYRARHDDDGFAIALFDRAVDAVTLRKTTELTSADFRFHLMIALDRYGIGLV